MACQKVVAMVTSNVCAGRIRPLPGLNSVKGRNLRATRRKGMFKSSEKYRLDEHMTKTKVRNDYRIFSIKRRGRLFKTGPRRPGVYSGSGVYLLNAFFSIGSLLKQEPKKKNITDRTSD